jgi:integrase
VSRPVPSVADFEAWLSQKVKGNGDKLLPSTIERYVALAEPFFSLGEELFNHEVVLARAQAIIASNNVLYFALKNMMEFLGYPRSVIDSFKAPRSRAKAASSQRFLQSKVLTRQEVQRLLAEISDPILALAFRVMYDTACRRAELLSIRWKEVYWKSRTKPEDASFIEQGIFAEVRIRGKGGKFRTVYFGKETADYIKRLHLQDAWEPDDYLVRFFARNFQGRLLKDQANKLYKSLVKEADRIIGRHVHPHALRHTRLTHLADAGADILDIAAFAGHEDISTTKIYVEISSHRARLAFANYSSSSTS